MQPTYFCAANLLLCSQLDFCETPPDAVNCYTTKVHLSFSLLLCHQIEFVSPNCVCVIKLLLCHQVVFMSPSWGCVTKLLLWHLGVFVSPSCVCVTELRLCHQVASVTPSWLCDAKFVTPSCFCGFVTATRVLWCTPCWCDFLHRKFFWISKLLLCREVVLMTPTDAFWLTSD